MGFNYTGTYQDDQTTRERAAGGECYVMVEGARIIATVMLYAPGPVPGADQDSWYQRPGVARCGQFAVEPELQGVGRGSRLMDVVEQRARAIGASELALDTAEGASHLIRYYTNREYRFIEYIQHQGKTYRSALLSKTLRES